LGTSERNPECIRESYDEYCNFSWLVAIDCGISKRTGSEEMFTIGLEVVYSINWNPRAATNSDNTAKLFFLIIYSGDLVTAGKNSIMEQLVRIKCVRVPSVRSFHIFPNKHSLKTIRCSVNNDSPY
jgi:hypothetical protein